MAALNTTAVLAYSARIPTTFVVVADAGNSVNVYISSQDPTCTDNIDQLSPGQDVSFNNWVGEIYWKAASSTANAYVCFVNQYNAASTVKS